MRKITGLVVTVALAGCTPSMSSNGEGGGGGKADGTETKLSCVQAEGDGSDEFKLRETWTITDEGEVDTWPEELPWGPEDLVADDLRIHKYAVKGDLKVGRSAWRTVDTTFYGRLYQTGGQIVSEDDEAWEIYVRESGEVMLTVAYEDSAHARASLACEGDLPSEAEVRGPDPDGLALLFTCEATPPDESPVSFQFALKRIDRLESITLTDFPGDNEETVTFPEGYNDSLIVLAQNTDIYRSARRITLTGDGDGVDFGKLRITVPKQAGDVETGKFYYECDDCGDEGVEWDIPVTCTTAEIPKE
jgi:hypothetical protein